MATADTRTEGWLEQHGATFVLLDVPTAAIDRDASHSNQARVAGPLHDETVLLYGCAMEAGEEFPPLVLYQNGGGRYVVVDGNHRVAAADAADIPALSAYVIRNPAPAMITALTYEANTKHGLPTSIAERVQQALHLEAGGMSRAEAARSLNLPVGRLEQVAEQQRADNRIGRVKRKLVGTLPASTRRRLDAIRSDRVLTAALDLLSETPMKYEDVNTLVIAINRERDEQGQMLAVERERGRQAIKAAATVKGRVRLPDSLRDLDKALVAISRLDSEVVRADLRKVGPDMNALLMGRVIDAHKRIRDILR